ncbi:Uncharacterised protein [Mycobacteroides abscessus]|nr:Uncharacterised protein [Mycobacteroides abscessus]
MSSRRPIRWPRSSNITASSSSKNPGCALTTASTPTIRPRARSPTDIAEPSPSSCMAASSSSSACGETRSGVTSNGRANCAPPPSTSTAASERSAQPGVRDRRRAASASAGSCDATSVRERPPGYVTTTAQHENTSATACTASASTSSVPSSSPSRSTSRVVVVSRWFAEIAASRAASRERAVSTRAVTSAWTPTKCVRVPSSSCTGERVSWFQNAVPSLR